MEQKIIRSAELRDIDGMKKLWSECFPNDIEYAQFFFEHIFRLSCAIVCEVDGSIAAMLHSFPYDFETPEGILRAKYIYGVGTSKKFRSRGIAGELLNYAASDCDFIVLIPQQESLFAFYEKYGYTELFHAYKADLPDGDFRRAGKGDIPKLDAIYEKAFGEYIRPKRSYDEWKLLLDEYEFIGGGFAISDKGYCAYYESDGKYKIGEMCPACGESFTIGTARLMSEKAKKVFSKGYKKYLNLMHN